MQKSDAKTLLLFGVLIVVVTAGVLLLGRMMGEPAPTVPQGPSAVPGAGELPPDSHPDLVAGLEALRAGSFEEAVQRLEEVPRTDPGYRMALARRGVAYSRLGRPDDALEVLTELGALEPGRSEVRRALGSARYLLGEYREAELEALRALELDPEDLPARFDVAFYRTAQDQVTEATSAYHRAVQRDEKQTHVFHALQRLQGLHESRPDLPAVHYALAYFAKVLGSHELEIRELEHYLELDPEGPGAPNARANLEIALPQGQAP